MVDAGGAVTPDEAAKSLADFIDKFDISKTGELWAPRGPRYLPHKLFAPSTYVVYRDIGTAEAVLGKGLSTPLQLPW